MHILNVTCRAFGSEFNDVLGKVFFLSKLKSLSDVFVFLLMCVILLVSTLETLQILDLLHSAKGL